MIKKVFVFGLITVSMMNVIAQETPVLLKAGLKEKDCGIAGLYVYDNKRLAYKEEYDNNGSTITILDDELEPARVITLPDLIITDNRNTLAIDGSYVIYIDNECDNRGGLRRRVPFTQTLFNNDENLEFLVMTCESGKPIKYEIMSEDGTILSTFLPGSEYNCFYSSAYVHSIGNTKYLVIEFGSGPTKYDFYKISDESPNNVSLNSVPLSSAFPNPVTANEPLTIQLDASTTLASGSYVEIINMAGATITRQPIEANDNQVSVSTQQLSQGHYIYNMVSGGEIIDSGKIVVR